MMCKANRAVCKHPGQVTTNTKQVLINYNVHRKPLSNHKKDSKYTLNSLKEPKI